MNRHKLFAFCLLLLALASCRKEEYKPVIDGEKIQHEELTTTLKEALDASSYTLFKAAWKRSNMDKLLNEAGKNIPHTLLVPTDEAFITEGLTLSVINDMEPRLLDSLLLYHTVLGAFDPVSVAAKSGSSQGISLLKNLNLRLRATEIQNRFDQYAYRQYLGILAGELMINGEKSGKLPAVITANGTLWPINRVLHKPTKTILTALQEDGRFGMYLGMLEMLDQLWMEDAMGIFPRTPYTAGWVLRYDPFGENVNMDFTTIFAPTDAVFQQAGYPDLDALVAFNNSRPRPYLDWETFTMAGGYAADSLLALNRFGVQFIPYSDYAKEYNQMVFYINDFSNDNLSDFNVMVSQESGMKAYKMPLEFGRDASGRILVKAKQSPHPAATVVEQINTLMGPIHVIDRLIPTKEFKF
jgi:uncharacterized surface protein with fasciclin (FAS1) repeats